MNTMYAKNLSSPTGLKPLAYNWPTKGFRQQKKPVPIRDALNAHLNKLNPGHQSLLTQPLYDFDHNLDGAHCPTTYVTQGHSPTLTTFFVFLGDFFKSK